MNINIRTLYSENAILFSISENDSNKMNGTQNIQQNKEVDS